jgi:hypothetical protein
VFINGSSTVKFKDCGIDSNAAVWVGSIYLNISWNVSSSPLEGSFPEPSVECCRREEVFTSVVERSPSPTRISPPVQRVE